MPPALATVITLSDSEKLICDLLIEVANFLNTSNPNKVPITLRIAGGWLLGLESHDLDIALDSIMGYEFAQAVNEYIRTYRDPQSQTDLSGSSENVSGTAKKKSSILGSIAKIDSNPEKSKHLETATAKVFGQMIDFVNLRTETYQEDSRIPQMEFGTPLQDALRRDITINALFYNLHTSKVEDHTSLGLSDLANGHVRTPLPPLQTFIDDPLRILRVIRFASRFGFTIEPDILEACRGSESVRAALGSKISRERIGVEVDKMLRGGEGSRGSAIILSGSVAPRHISDVERAVRLIYEFDIAEDVLVEAPVELRYLGSLPVGSTILPPAPGIATEAAVLDAAVLQPPPDLSTGLNVAEVLTFLLGKEGEGEGVGGLAGMKALSPPEKSGVALPLGVEEVRLLYLSAMASPFMGRAFLEKKKNVMPAAKYVIMNSLKLSAIDADWVVSILAFVPQIQNMVNQIYREHDVRTNVGVRQMDLSSDSTTSISSRKTLGLFIRELGVRSIYTGCRPLGGKYTLAVFMAMAIEISGAWNRSSTMQPFSMEEPVNTETSATQEIISKYRVFWRAVVEEHGVDAAWQLKPIMNGGEVAKLHGIRAGPVVGRLLQMMVEYQLEHPEASKSDVTEWMKGIDVGQISVQ
ncbi:CCA tRNA nucleotidyltransferase, mitochondrial [Chytriomyces hyalinus]|nr:CCA tRNA nucleotidyltransferase, mitochondrial [Chytriomyces hyalinus]